MSILTRDRADVQPPPPVDFPDVYPDECPELPDSDFYEPDPSDWRALAALDSEAARCPGCKALAVKLAGLESRFESLARLMAQLSLEIGSGVAG